MDLSFLEQRFGTFEDYKPTSPTEFDGCCLGWECGAARENALETDRAVNAKAKNFGSSVA